jgi:hypothetical protein
MWLDADITTAIAKTKIRPPQLAAAALRPKENTSLGPTNVGVRGDLADIELIIKRLV